MKKLTGDDLDREFAEDVLAGAVRLTYTKRMGTWLKSAWLAGYRRGLQAARNVTSLEPGRDIPVSNSHAAQKL